MVEEELIPIIQQKFKSIVKEQLGADHKAIKNWKGYRFQIYGRTLPDGEKGIYINAISKDFWELWVEPRFKKEPYDLRTNMMGVSHKDDDYFVVAMDPETLAFTALYID